MKRNSHICLLTAALLSIAITAWATDKPVTLKDVYGRHFLVGTAINRNMAAVTGGRRSLEQTVKDVAFIKQQFNQISPENDLKWQLVHPREGADGYDFGPADAFVNFGVSNKMYVVGHTLVWHSQTPTWVFADTNPPPVVANVAIPPGKPVHLRAEIDYERLYFAYRVEGVDKNWRWLPQQFDASILSDEATVPGQPNFTGAFVGMACQDLAGTARPADFDFFVYRERDFLANPFSA